MGFVLGCIPPAEEGSVQYQFLFQKGNLLVKQLENGYTIPVSEDLGFLEDRLSDKLYIGSIDTISCYAAKYPENEAPAEGMELVGLRQLFEKIDSSILQAAFRAVQIVAWDETHKYCGVCGEATSRGKSEHVKVCPKCGHSSYPRLSPAVIVAVTKEDKLLLARNKNFVSGLYSVLAGFVEAGETLEECVHREIREETGIEVKNIKYFGSQSWPFPNSYMLAFTAEYDSGDIQVDENEIAEARWFSVEEIPKFPNSISIARKLIEWFIEKYK